MEAIKTVDMKHTITLVMSEKELKIFYALIDSGLCALQNSDTFKLDTAEATHVARVILATISS